MNFEKTNLRKVYIKKLKVIFSSDSRGIIVETYLSKKFFKTLKLILFRIYFQYQKKMTKGDAW